MAQQYWIGDFFVDLTRNQITQNQQPQVIAPKALAVLTFLAKNQGKVVSQQQLLDAVWPNIVVSPNTLQRSIAQLRKALGDDGKTQDFIKTHAKQGYSLECQVTWSNDNIASTNRTIEIAENNAPVSDVITNEAHASPKEEQVKPQSKKHFITIVISFFIVVLLTVAAKFYLNDTHSDNLTLGNIRALTATDGKELASIYSPDGKYVIFHRFSEKECVNDIWAKNLATQEEHKLTEKIDAYGRHSFSPDGKQLVFIRTLNCETPITQKQCYQLLSLDFDKALHAPQPTKLMLECKNSEIRRPHWLTNQRITLLQKQTERWQLISYSSHDDSSELLHEVKDGNIIYYDYSAKRNLIAVTSIQGDNNYYIEILTPQGAVISKKQIRLPDDIVRFRYIAANFSPIDDQLIFSTGRQLYTLHFDGSVSPLGIVLDQPVGSPNFHPKDTRALVIKGNYDSDILSIAVTDFNESDSQMAVTANASVLERSTVADDNAVIQPNGNLIAFVSERSGEEQIWLTDGQKARQLSQLPIDSYIAGMQWSSSGESLLFSANDELYQIELNGKSHLITTNNPITELLQWDSTQNKALLLSRIKGINKLVEFDLAKASSHIISEQQVKWAKYSDNGQLIFTDQLDRFWQQDVIEAQLIEALVEQGGDNQGFLIKDNVIYGVNKQFQLWSFNLSNQSFNILAELPKTLVQLSDIDDQQLLFTIHASGKKEVVELQMHMTPQ
ncbi:winged helix-turn-helix domain-containing protein [Thalassotalea marina]|uniref:Biopolymer transporter Tol n=1 Tax=Thalassotalea marina TaxID=1673741 RepID=A0A919BKD8_9GAMM|nr:winged helix-turn-helix domain-containing protein [Thalassotalea marina]GHF94642.1 biopolymer transporter Tol [Thalassotalea marina]